MVKVARKSKIPSTHLKLLFLATLDVKGKTVKIPTEIQRHHRRAVMLMAALNKCQHPR